jgi:hypothetical protein
MKRRSTSTRLHSAITEGRHLIICNLIVAQLINKFLAHYENRRLITIFTIAPHWILLELAEYSTASPSI